MSARHMDFGSPVLSSDEPLTFSIYGQTFRCTPMLQGRALVDFIAAGSDRDNPGSSAEAILNLFDRALMAEDRERFTELSLSDDYIIPLEKLTEIMDWLVEQYTGRPTQQPELLPDGQEITGPTPVAVLSQPQVSASTL